VFRIVRAAGLIAAIIAFALPSYAEEEGSGKCSGLRAGYGIDPDQFVIGLQGDFGNVLKIAHLAASADAGFGDNLTTIVLGADALVFLPLPKSDVSFYGAAGPALTIWTPDQGETDTEIGLALTIGARFPLGDSGWYNLEGRFGVGDVPDVRILLGVLFGGR